MKNLDQSIKPEPPEEPEDEVRTSTSSTYNCETHHRDGMTSVISSTEISMPTGLANVVAWRNRQRMAYMAIISMMFVMAALFFIADSTKVDKIGGIATWFFMSMASIVVAFFGWKSYENVKGR